MPRSTFAVAALCLIVGAAGGVAGTYGYLHQQAPELAGGGGGPVVAPVIAPAKVEVLAPTRPDGVVQLVRNVRGAVVNIDVESARVVPPDTMDFFDEGDARSRRQVVRGVGSGFVMEHDGLIATNNHVVEGAKVLNVTFYDGKKYPAVVVGTDPSTDLAVVRIQAPRQAGLKLATPESLQVGEYVVAMGSPLGLQQTVTMGVLSALDRDIGMDTRVGFLQTDAPINPGNSGGPLMNLSGEVLGINSAVAQSAQGIGFATPVGTLRSVLPQLAAGVKVDKAWFGARTANVPGDPARMTYPRRTGVLVTGLEQGSPASQGGLQAGDVLVQINGRPIEDSGTLMQVLAPLDAGSHVTMVVARQGVARTVAITLGTPPRG